MSESGVAVGIHGAFVGDVEGGRESALREVQIRVAGNGRLSPAHAREFAADVFAAAEQAERRNRVRQLARALPARAEAGS